MRFGLGVDAFASSLLGKRCSQMHLRSSPRWPTNQALQCAAAVAYTAARRSVWLIHIPVPEGVWRSSKAS